MPKSVDSVGILYPENSVQVNAMGYKAFSLVLAFEGYAIMRP